MSDPVTQHNAALARHHLQQANNPVTQMTQNVARSAAGKKAYDMQQIEKVAKDFEAVFLSEMFKPMFKGIKPDPMFGGGKGEEVFQGLMIQEYGKIVAERGGVGLADHVKAEIIRLQEEAQK